MKKEPNSLAHLLTCLLLWNLSAVGFFFSQPVLLLLFAIYYHFVAKFLSDSFLLKVISIHRALALSPFFRRARPSNSIGLMQRHEPSPTYAVHIVFRKLLQRAEPGEI
jgi:hypothetical protein